jgi:DNA-binding CsgD family transcriptional regulator
MQMGISPKTVENHKQRIFSKLGVQNQAHAVAVAVRQGLVDPTRRILSTPAA